MQEKILETIFTKIIKPIGQDTPEDLIPQFIYIRKAVEAFNIPSIELVNYEADDLIATYKEQASKKNIKVTIISSDKDLMQLVDENTFMLDSNERQVYWQRRSQRKIWSISR